MYLPCPPYLEAQREGYLWFTYRVARAELLDTFLNVNMIEADWIAGIELSNEGAGYVVFKYPVKDIEDEDPDRDDYMLVDADAVTQVPSANWPAGWELVDMPSDLDFAEAEAGNGVPAPLMGTSLVVNSLIIVAHTGNVNPIFIGDDTIAIGAEGLLPGASLSWPIAEGETTDINKVYAIAAAAGNTMTLWYSED